MDNTLAFLVLLGLAIIAIVIFAGYKAWSDYGKQRKILTRIALQTNATRKGNTLSGQRSGVRFRFSYHVGFDEYTLAGMEILLAVPVPVTLIIYRAPFKKIALKTGLDKMSSMMPNLAVNGISSHPVPTGLLLQDGLLIRSTVNS